MENGARQNTPNSGGNSGANSINQNQAARNAILAIAQNMVQPLQGANINLPGSASNVVNVSPRLVGFVKRFWIEVDAVITNPDPNNDLTLTPWGPANLFSNVQFNDLSNNVRINCAGWFLHAVSTAKRGQNYGAAFLNDSPVAFGSNNPNVIYAPPVIAKNGGTGRVKFIYEVPLAYSDTDFRGAIWFGVTNATANLQLTINPNPTAPSYAQGGDPTLAVYQGSNAGVITSLTYQVYQNYLDQLPTVQPQGQAPQTVLPVNDISTVYLLNTTSQQNMIVNQDFPVPYANFRDFLSTTVIFDNGGQLNNGQDVGYWGIQAANYVFTLKTDPNLLALWSRNMLMDDWPAGTAYFSHRHKPISTIQYGNQSLILNASVVNPNAKLFIGYEQFALVNLIAQAGALAIA